MWAQCAPSPQLTWHPCTDAPWFPTGCCSDKQAAAWLRPGYPRRYLERAAQTKGRPSDGHQQVSACARVCVCACRRPRRRTGMLPCLGGRPAARPHAASPSPAGPAWRCPVNMPRHPQPLPAVALRAGSLPPAAASLSCSWSTSTAGWTAHHRQPPSCCPASQARWVTQPATTGRTTRQCLPTTSRQHSMQLPPGRQLLQPVRPGSCSCRCQTTHPSTVIPHPPAGWTAPAASTAPWRSAAARSHRWLPRLQSPGRSRPARSRGCSRAIRGMTTCWTRCWLRMMMTIPSRAARQLHLASLLLP